MEDDKVCGTCLSRGGHLVKEKIGESVAAVCPLCQGTIRRLRAFADQCAMAETLLQEYSCATHMYKTWEEFCQVKNLGSNGLQYLRTSSILHITVTSDEDQTESMTSKILDKEQNRKCVHHTEHVVYKHVRENHKNKKRKKKTKDIHVKKKRKPEEITEANCDEVDNMDNVNLKELFDKRTESHNESVIVKEDISAFYTGVIIKEEFSDLETTLLDDNDQGHSSDQYVKEEIVIINKQDVDLSTETTNIISKRKNTKLKDLNGAFHHSNEDCGSNDTKKEKKLSKRRGRDTVKMQCVPNELEVTGLLMFQGEVGEEEQKEDMRRRLEDSEYITAEYKCDLCCFGFKFHNSYETHMKKHSKEAGEYECWLCHQRFPSKAKLATHRRCRHSQKMWCGACSRRFYNKTRLKDHIETHKGFFHKCDTCSRTFQSKGTLTRHLMSHQESQEFKCQYCSRMLKSKESFKSHLLIHLDSRPYACSECPAAFSVRKRLDIHVLRKHRPPSGQHYCVECDFNFKTATDYKTHLSAKKHTDPSLLKFPCNKCSRRYTTEAALSRHTAAMHERILQYSCPLCPSRYATTQGLNFHRRKAHEGFVLDKKYLCVYCPKAFISKALLESHTRTHTGEQPFQCTLCGRAFTQRSSLHTHVKLVHLKKKRSDTVPWNTAQDEQTG